MTCSKWATLGFMENLLFHIPGRNTPRLETLPTLLVSEGGNELAGDSHGLV